MEGRTLDSISILVTLPTRATTANAAARTDTRIAQTNGTVQDTMAGRACSTLGAQQRNRQRRGCRGRLNQKTSCPAGPQHVLHNDVTVRTSNDLKHQIPWQCDRHGMT